MADKFVLITFKPDDVGVKETPYEENEWYNRNYLIDQILAINLAYNPGSAISESEAPEFVSKLRDLNSDPTSVIDRKIFDFEPFNISEDDIVYILHHHSKNPTLFNAALNNVFKENKTKYIYPYSSTNKYVSFKDVFPNKLDNAKSLKKNIQNAIENHETYGKYAKEEERLFDQSKKQLEDKHPGREIKICLLKIEGITKNSLEKVALPPKFKDIYSENVEDKPIIFTGTFNLFVENNNTPDRVKNALDPRYRFFDSSIWFRYVPLSQLEELFPKYIDEYKKKNNYFGLPEATEFREFAIRQFNESYIKNNGSGHSDHIAPFGFHSESKMERWAEEEKNMINGFKWNVLIVDDDFAENIDNKSSKKNLINEVIRGYSANENYHEKTIKAALDKIRIPSPGIRGNGVNSNASEESLKKNAIFKVLSCIRSLISWMLCKSPKPVKETEDTPSSKGSPLKYDIILLDYYFRPTGIGARAEYGEEFLVELLQPEKADTEKEYLNDKYLGPTGKFWIFPISVYSTSLVDKLRDNRITWYDDKWIISPGADPLNTPELFRYKIFSFMRRQLEEFSIQYYDKSDKQKKLFSQLAFHLVNFMFNLKEGEKPSDNEVICKWEKEPYTPKENDEIKNVQKYMINVFPKIVEQGVKFKRLCENKETSSLAGTVIEKYYFNFRKYDWDHFQNLIYLVAYGNRSNLDQVWNELNYIEIRYNEKKQEKNKDHYDEVLKAFIAVVKAYLE